MVVVKSHMNAEIAAKILKNSYFCRMCGVQWDTRFNLFHKTVKDMITFGFRNKFGGWLRAITAIVLGIIMVSKPETSLIIVVKVLAAFLIASGIVSLVYGIINRQRGALSLMVTNAVVDIALGVVLFIFPKEIASFMLILIGILVLIFGISQIAVLISASRVVSSSFAVYILPSLCIIGGIVLLIRPFDSISALVLLAGIAVLVYGVSEFIATWKMNRAMKATEVRQEKSSGMDDFDNVKDVDYEKVEEGE